MIARPISRPVTSPIARAVNAQFGAVWNPRALFALGEQGVWYDPNDLTTLFQDSAGTTPVTAAGQPVGLMLDKRMGLMRGPELVTNGSFDVNLAGWTNQNPAIIAGSVTAGAALIEMTGAAGSGYYQDIPLTTGKFSLVTIRARKVGALGLSIVQVGSYLSFGPLGSKTVTSTAFADYQFIVPATQGGYRVYLKVQDTGAKLEVDSVSVRELPGNHAYQASAASRPMLRQNATTGAYYLETDGSADYMASAPIDFTATDQMSVFVGARKLSDATAGILCELSTNATTANGSFYIAAPINNTTPTYGTQLRGTTAAGAQTLAGFAAPHSAVLTLHASIGAIPIRQFRVNGGEYNVNNASAGAGNFGNHALYLFRRAGINLPFNGHLYGLIITGRLCTDAETRDVERLLARNTGVTLA